MVEENSKNENGKEKNSLVKIQLDELVEIKTGEYKGKKAKVIQVRDNSVIVELGLKTKAGEPVLTVVNHKNYKKLNK
ncbi:DUF2187 family protein [Neobacillus niacini]|uniref:DUF2187 family protein n=1 Tax=Neobacillus niacini TaxID=86668 RepID=UPI00285EDF16|nr:DUF2187 family protein [Neobacillus niacini]MDR7000129.1 uncharacterized protein YkvS [Neobacillus niacini]